MEHLAWSFESLSVAAMQTATKVHYDCVDCDVLRRQHRQSLISTLRYGIGENYGGLIIIHIHDVRPLLYVYEVYNPNMFA